MEIETYVTALAGEGVPLGCIARAFRLDRGRLKMIVDDALKNGFIAEAPAPDWLRTRFDDRPGFGASPPPEQVIRPTRASVLLARYDLAGRRADLLLELLDREFLPAEEAIDRFTSTGSDSVLRKQLTAIRAATRKDSVSIINKHGVGYYLSAPSRARLNAIFMRAGCIGESATDTAGGACPPAGKSTEGTE
jgi:hypothetical protein